MRATKWLESPFLKGGWCTRGVGRERVLETGVEEGSEKEQKGELDWEEEEFELGLWLWVTKLAGREAEQPMIGGQVRN